MMEETKEKYFELELPSRLLPYRGEGVEKVEIRMLKGRDEKLLGEINLQNFEKKFAFLLSYVLRGIPPENLTIGDRFYIVIWVAINCYSNLYPIELECDECYRKIKVDVDLGKLEKKMLPEDYKEPYELELTNGETIKLRLMRVKDQIQYINWVQAKGEDDPLYYLAMGIIDDQTDLLKKIEYLGNLSTQDLGLIRAFHEKYQHGVNLDYGYTCPKCGGAGVVPVPFRFDIIFPDGATVARALGRSV